MSPPSCCKRAPAYTMREGRFCPTYDENDTMTLPCDHVCSEHRPVRSTGAICWTGTKPWSWAAASGAVADPLTYQTAQPDIFVGGDVYTGPKFAIDAIAAGKQGGGIASTALCSPTPA